MLNATRVRKGLGVRRVRNPIPAYAPLQVKIVTGTDGNPSVSLLPIEPKVKKQKVYPQGKY